MPGSLAALYVSACKGVVGSEAKRILVEIQKKVINPITHKPTFRTPDEVLEEALDHLYKHLKQQKVL